jgi:hypothetical protein
LKIKFVSNKETHEAVITPDSPNDSNKKTGAKATRLPCTNETKVGVLLSFNALKKSAETLSTRIRIVYSRKS